jgi:ribosomal protein L33
MSRESQELTRIAKKSYGESISDGFRLFGKNWSRIIVPLTLFYVIYLFLKIFLLADLNWQRNVLGENIIGTIDPSNLTEADIAQLMNFLLFGLSIIFIDSIINSLFIVLAMSSVSIYLYKKYLNLDTDFVQDIKKSYNSKLFVVLAILGLGVPLGFWFLLIPGFTIFGLYICSVFTYQFENIEKPLKQARLITKGAFWKIIGVLVISSLIIRVISMIFGLFLNLVWQVDAITLASWYNPATRRYDMLFLNELLNNLVSIILGPLFICLLTTLFTSLKVRFDLGYRRGYFQVPTELYRTEQVQVQPERAESGLYCPVCGHHMEFKFKFCPNCGESLDFKA